jgi:hypothetical protein
LHDPTNEPHATFCAEHVSPAEGVQHAPVNESQTCPTGHEPPLHTQRALVHVGVVPVQSRHAAPPVPQLALPDVMHVLLLQQPLPHEVASHTHWCAVVHSWPIAHVPQLTVCPHEFVKLPHAKPLPVHVSVLVQHVPLKQIAPPAQELNVHWHVPPLPHVGVVPVHAVHPPPPVPQKPLFGCISHVVPLQQPLGHDVESHTHVPLVESHRWPAGHDVELHTHPPVALHVGFVPVHAMHAAPPAPQVPLLSPASCTHDVPEQQPLHCDPPQVHAPFEHDWPLTHGAQAAPALPHLVASCDVNATHAPVASQQPFGHDLASHTHRPLALHS